MERKFCMFCCFYPEFDFQVGGGGLHFKEEFNGPLMAPLDVQLTDRQSDSLTDRNDIWVIVELTVCRRVNLRLHEQFLDIWTVSSLFVIAS